MWSLLHQLCVCHTQSSMDYFKRCLLNIDYLQRLTLASWLCLLPSCCNLNSYLHFRCMLCVLREHVLKLLCASLLSQKDLSIGGHYCQGGLSARRLRIPKQEWTLFSHIWALPSRCMYQTGVIGVRSGKVPEKRQCLVCFAHCWISNT